MAALCTPYKSMAGHAGGIKAPNQAQRLSAAAQRRSTLAASAAPEVWALDFDGVACDSVGESSLSAFKVCGCSCRGCIRAASALWPLETRELPGVVAGTVGCAALPQAAAKLWPEVFATPAAEARKEELVEKMRVVRPVVETG